MKSRVGCKGACGGYTYSSHLERASDNEMKMIAIKWSSTRVLSPLFEDPRGRCFGCYKKGLISVDSLLLLFIRLDVNICHQ